MCNRRSLALLALALCGCGNAVSTMDAAQSPDAGTAPDLAPVCLPVEPAPPALDPNCPVVKPAMADALDDALAHEGLDRCSLTLPTAGYAGVMKDPYKLPWYDQAHDFVVNAPSWARTLTARLDSAAASATPVANLLVTLGDRLGPSIAACAPAFAIDPSRPLAAALSALIVHTGGKADEAALDAAVAPVPMDLQRALAPIVFAIETANDDWTSLTQSLSPDDLTVLAGTSGLVLVGAGGMPPDLSNSEVKTLLSKTFDESALVTGAAKLAHAVESAKLAPYAGTMGFHVDIKTPIGRVVIADGRDDTYEDDGSDAIALLVDTGGNDVYRKPIGAVGGTQAVGTQQSAIHVAVAIDLAGNDQYGYPETPDPGDIAQDKAMAGIARLPSDSFGRYVRRAPDDLGPVSLSDEVRQGGARLGYGLLFDYGGGNDHYRALRMSQGFGCAGVGVLFDDGGDDLYEGEAGVQGAAIFGVGLLFDKGGKDQYKTYSYSQGFGYTRGVGALYDASGDDQYFADTGIPALGGDPIYFSPQAPCDSPTALCGNSSMAQGMGFGRRAPGNGDNANLAGGLGVLRDLAGDDRYVASVFAQASGYWFGTGILEDAAGSDHYDGWWYTQGSAAHAALCVFEDDAGDDFYDQTYPMNPPYATNTGQGHDYSVGWHLDFGGNDVYRAPNLSLGSGNANGGGFLINVGGDDTYVSSSPFTLGGAAFDLSVNRPTQTPCYGLFLDVIGNDTYMVPADPKLQPPPANDTVWTNPRDPAPYDDKSIGVDRSSGAVNFP